VALTRPQLAAAAIVLVASSAIATWWVGPGVGGERQVALAAPAAGDVTMVAAVPAPPNRLVGELATLQQVIDSARTRLDPNTLRVLERNLGVIEHAIADSRQALALDPGNEYLTHHLERVYERKLEYLRDAARVIDWAG
jgi:hypothetical protein